jgi:hypothetical protein
MIHGSSWIRSLEEMNRIHPAHSSAMFSQLRHFVFTFKESTFECVAKGFRSKILNRRHSEFVSPLTRFGSAGRAEVPRTEGACAPFLFEVDGARSRFWGHRLS